MKVFYIDGITLVQLSALAFNVPNNILSRFNNHFQIAALNAGVPYQFAVNMNDLNAILDYFCANRDIININEIIEKLTGNITINTLINSATSLEGLAQITALRNALQNLDELCNERYVAPTSAPTEFPTFIPTFGDSQLGDGNNPSQDLFLLGKEGMF